MGSPIFEGTPYDTNKRYRRAIGDVSAAAEETAAAAARTAAAAATTAAEAATRAAKSNLPKYLLWCAAILAAILLYKKFVKK